MEAAGQVFCLVALTSLVSQLPALPSAAVGCPVQFHRCVEQGESWSGLQGLAGVHGQSGGQVGTEMQRGVDGDLKATSSDLEEGVGGAKLSWGVGGRGRAQG